MKAVWYERKGAAREVLTLGEMPDPEPGPGEVRVAIRVSGVNPSDTKGRSGWRGGMAMPVPRIVPHQDGAGVIDKVGAGVPPARRGERVWVYEAQQHGRAFGTAAEYTIVPAGNAIPLPDDVGFDVGACLGVPALTAHRCLFQDGGIQGQTVLVQGGAGVVGLAAVQMAKWGGARVVATVSRPAQEAIVRAAGADIVVNRRSGDLAAAIRKAAGRVDRIVDVSFEENSEIDRAVLKPNGVISTYSAHTADSAPAIPFAAAMAQNLTVHFVLVYTMPEEAHRIAARDTNTLLMAGAYKPVIAQRVPLDRCWEAHQAQEAGTALGKILVEVAPE